METAETTGNPDVIEKLRAQLEAVTSRLDSREGVANLIGDLFAAAQTMPEGAPSRDLVRTVALLSMQAGHAGYRANELADYAVRRATKRQFLSELVPQFPAVAQMIVELSKNFRASESEDDLPPRRVRVQRVDVPIDREHRFALAIQALRADPSRPLSSEQIKVFAESLGFDWDALTQALVDVGVQIAEG